MDTAHLLRPNQVNDLLDDKQSLENSLKSPHLQDRGAVHTQLRRLNKQIDQQAPKQPSGAELDKLVKQEASLREKILTGMPSQEEMRKCPPGAIGKETKWNKKNKNNMLAWKNTMLRLNAGTDDPDVANFERYRPISNSLNMDNAQIPGKQYYLPTEAYKAGYDNVDWNTEEKKPRKKAKKRTKAWKEERSKQAKIEYAERQEKLKAEQDAVIKPHGDE